MKKFLALAALTAASLTGAAASIVSTAAPAAAQEVFFPGRQLAFNGQWEGAHDAQGRIVHFDGGYNLRLHVDGQGFLFVRLHPGTVINPRGLTLHRGMLVNVRGFFADGAFHADVINLR
jgi:hypothetical protein